MGRAWKLAALFDGEPIKPVINLLAAAVSVSSCKSNRMLSCTLSPVLTQKHKKEWKMQIIVIRHGPCFFLFCFFKGFSRTSKIELSIKRKKQIKVWRSGSTLACVGNTGLSYLQTPSFGATTISCLSCSDTYLVAAFADRLMEISCFSVVSCKTCFFPFPYKLVQRLNHSNNLLITSSTTEKDVLSFLFLWFIVMTVNICRQAALNSVSLYAFK